MIMSQPHLRLWHGALYAFSHIPHTVTPKLIFLISHRARCCFAWNMRKLSLGFQQNHYSASGQSSLLMALLHELNCLKLHSEHPRKQVVVRINLVKWYLKIQKHAASMYILHISTESWCQNEHHPQLKCQLQYTYGRESYIFIDFFLYLPLLIVKIIQW